MAFFTYDPIDLGRPAFRLVRLLKGSSEGSSKDYFSDMENDFSNMEDDFSNMEDDFSDDGLREDKPRDNESSEGGSIEDESDKDDICCELYQTFLDDREDVVSFEALSYTWGSPTKTDYVTMDGKRLSVTSNLHKMLKSVRLKNEDRMIWVDALCIDQGNHIERGHQVNQMGDIYKRAWRVVFWLGDAIRETNALIDSLSLLREESNKWPYRAWKVEDEQWKEMWSGLKRDLAYKLHGLDDFQREGLRDLLRRPWFSRVWIIQEVANASSALVQCGTRSVSSVVFVLATHLLDIFPNPHTQAILDLMPGPSRHDLDSWLRQNRSLFALLCRFRGSEASDPRDMVYALLGLSSDANHSDILQPDYGISVDLVINNVLRWLCPAKLDWNLAERLWRDKAVSEATRMKLFLDDLCTLCLKSFGNTAELGSLLQHNLDIQITPDIILAAEPQQLMTIIHHREAEVTVAIVSAAAAVISHKYEEHILSTTVEAVAQFWGKIPDQRGPQIELLDRIVQGVLENPVVRGLIIKQLLRVGPTARIVVGVVEHIRHRPEDGEELLHLLHHLVVDSSTRFGGKIEEETVQSFLVESRDEMVKENTINRQIIEGRQDVQLAEMIVELATKYYKKSDGFIDIIIRTGKHDELVMPIREKLEENMLLLRLRPEEPGIRKMVAALTALATCTVDSPDGVAVRLSEVAFKPREAKQHLKVIPDSPIKPPMHFLPSARRDAELARSWKPLLDFYKRPRYNGYSSYSILRRDPVPEVLLFRDNQPAAIVVDDSTINGWQLRKALIALVHNLNLAVQDLRTDLKATDQWIPLYVSRETGAEIRWGRWASLDRSLDEITSLNDRWGLSDIEGQVEGLEDFMRLFCL